MLSPRGQLALVQAQACRMFAAANLHLIGKATKDKVRKLLPPPLSNDEYMVARLVDQLNDRHTRWNNLMLEYVAMTLDADAESSVQGFRDWLTLMGCPANMQPPPNADRTLAVCFAQARLVLADVPKKGLH